jgi:predicted ribosome quality control (RQC) complex YloA/Tae2 family protein
MKYHHCVLRNSNQPICYLIGQNAYENTEIIQQSKLEDYWFHAELESSCHVVAVVPKSYTKKDKQQIIKTGAFLCKYHTQKLRKEDEVAITYTKISNIHHTSIPGMVYINHDGIGDPRSQIHSILV